MNRVAMTFLTLTAFAGNLAAQTAPGATPLPVASSEAPSLLRFRWTQGQSFDLKVMQATDVIETSIDEQSKKPVTVTTKTKLHLTKRWTVKSVEANGTATIELSVTAMRQEMNQSAGDEKPVTRILDSTNPDDAKVMTFLNKTAVTVKVDILGRLLDTQSATEGAADRLQVELPFRATFPNDPAKVGSSWDREFQMKLPPPLGTGEKLDGTQTYTYKGMSGDFAIVGLVTALKASPTDAALMPAVVPALWTGDVFVNAKTGAYQGVKLVCKKEVANHQGEGTKFSYRSEFTEVAAGK